MRHKIEQIIQEKGEITHNELCKLNENIPSRSLLSVIRWLVRHSIINEKEKPLYAKLVKACKCGRTKIVFQSDDIWVIKEPIKPFYWYPRNELKYKTGNPS